MKKVVIAGSANIKVLPPEALKKLDNIIANGLMVLVGDCYGVDALVQAHCKGKDYSNVLVYHVGAKPRINLGFPTIKVNAMGLSGRAYFTAKDVRMCSHADYGLMIWDGKSKGTARNIDQLQKEKKYVVTVKNVE